MPTMDNNHGLDGSWIGLGITLFIGIIAKVTLNDIALFSTTLAALSTVAYNIYKWRKNK